MSIYNFKHIKISIEQAIPHNKDKCTELLTQCYMNRQIDRAYIYSDFEYRESWHDCANEIDMSLTDIRFALKCLIIAGLVSAESIVFEDNNAIIVRVVLLDSEALTDRYLDIITASNIEVNSIKQREQHNDKPN